MAEDKVTKKTSKKVAKKVVKKAEAPVVESKGIKETKEVLQLVFALMKTFKAAKADDGNINMADVKHLVALFPNLSPAVEGITEVPAEIKDLNEAEAKELLTFAAAHLGQLAGEEEELVEKIEKGLVVAIALVDLIKVLK